MPRKAQSAKPAYSGAKAKTTARKPKDAPRTAGKPTGGRRAKPQDNAAPEGFYKPEGSEEAEAILKRYAGRPTKYDPAYCHMVILWGRLGKSRTWMAGEMMVVRQTLDNWANEHPDFAEALAIAKQLEQQHWEDLGSDNIRAVGFQGSVWRQNMSSRFAKEWRETKDINHGVTDALAELLGEIDGHGAALV
jgi:hypothetical protein